MREQKINYLDNFWDLYQMLPRETARYVPRFLATLLIVKEPEKYGFTFDELDSPLVYETITIEKQVRLEAVADALGIPHDDLVILNPELKIGITPPVKYNLNVPDINKDILLSKLDSIPAWATPKNDYSSSDYVLHKVKKGETLSRIAVKYRTSVVAIMKKNKLNVSSILPIGKKLKIPL
jgi:membrane-bound lytic murein transglycosylase D